MPARRVLNLWRKTFPEGRRTAHANMAHLRIGSGRGSQATEFCGKTNRILLGARDSWLASPNGSKCSGHARDYRIPPHALTVCRPGKCHSCLSSPTRGCDRGPLFWSDYALLFPYRIMEEWPTIHQMTRLFLARHGKRS